MSTWPQNNQSIYDFEIKLDEELFLRRLNLASSQAIFEAIDHDRMHLRKWLPFVDNTWRAEDTETFIKSMINSHCFKKDMVFEIWNKNDFAGLIALKEIDKWNRRTELGFWIISEFEGLGIITRSCRLLIQLAFTELGMNRIQLKSAIGNARSAMVAERLEFRFEGIERGGELSTEQFFDLQVYSQLNSEWQRLQAKINNQDQFKE